MAFNAGTAVVHVVADSSALQASITGAATNAVGRAGATLQRVGLGMTKFISAPLALLGAASTKMALDFEQSFAKIGALAGGIGVPMKEAEARVKALAHATGQDPGGLADALYFVASAGVDAQQVMPILGASARAAATGMGDASTIAQLLTTVLHDYEGTGLDAAKAMNILTGAIKVGKAEPADLAAVIGQVIPVASQMGISFQDVAAAFAQSTNAGNDAARSATGLRFLIAALQNPTEKAKKVFEDYGVAIGNLQERLTHPGGLLKVMQSLADQFDLSTVKGKAAWATITGGARGAVIANTLVANSADSAREVWEKLGEAASDTSTLFQDAFRKMTSTDAFKFQRLLADAKTALINLGEAIIPVLVEDVIPAVQKVVRWFKNLSDGTRGLIVKWGLLAIALGPVLGIFGTILRIGGSLIGVITRIGTAVAGTTAAGAGAGAGSGSLLAFLASPPALAIAGVVAGIGGAMLLAADNTRDFNNEVKTLIGTFRQIPGSIEGATTKVQEYAKAREDALKTPLGTLSLGFQAKAGFLGPRDVQVATEALKKFHSQMTRLANSVGVTNVVTLGWLGNLLRTSELTKKQATFLANAVAGVDRLGGSLKESERRGIANLIAMGDFNGALAILDKAATRAAGPLRNMQNAHRQAAEAAADQAQKVKQLQGRLDNLPARTNVKVDTTVNDSALDSLRSKMLSMGFVQRGGEWAASGKMRVSIVGGSPMPVEQFRIQIEEPLKRLGFQKQGVDWVVRLFAKFHLAGGGGEGDAVTKLEGQMRRIQKVIERLSSTVSDAISKAKEKLQEAIEKKVGVAAARMAVETAQAARDVVKAYQHMVNVAQRQLDKLVEKFRNFKSTIRDGFSELQNLAGAIGSLFGQTDEEGNVIPVTAADISSAIQDQVAQAQRLAELLTEAAEKGLSQGLIAQFAAQGADAIPGLEALLQNPALIAQLNAAAATIAEAAGNTADALGEKFFGKAIRNATNRIEHLANTIVRAIAHIQQALGGISAATAAALANIQAAAQAATTPPPGPGGGNQGGPFGMDDPNGPYNTGWGGQMGWRNFIRSGGAERTVTVNVTGWVGNDQDIAARVRNELVRIDRNNGRIF